MYHTQLGELIDLACGFPETPIGLDHVGGAIGLGPYAGKRDEVFAAWSGQIRELAACPNAHIKLGGLGHAHIRVHPSRGQIATELGGVGRAWRPCIEACIGAFGLDRPMFESNFPVDKSSRSYMALWNAFKRIAAGCSTAEKAALFGGTASNFYRLE